MNGTKLTGIIGHVNKELSSVELARIEFEKNLEDDPNNEWLKRLIAGLKMAEQSLQHLEAIENTKLSDVMGCLKRVWNDINNQNDFRQDFKDLTIVENYILKTQEQEELLGYITRFIDDVEISDNGVCYVSFKNNTPYLDCIEMDKEHYNKFKKIKESQKGE